MWRGFIIVVLLSGCSFIQEMLTMTEPQLADRLLRAGYVGLFMTLDDAEVNAIWAQPGAAPALSRLALDEGAPMQARFLAAEVLFYKDPDYPPAGDEAALAPVYAAALANNYTTMANPWGLPGQLDGLAGQHFIALGEAAIPSLVGLLDDTTAVDYGGSREATYGNSFSYRVKDLAAFFISQIRGLPYEVYESPQARDAEIERLREQL